MMFSPKQASVPGHKRQILFVLFSECRLSESLGPGELFKTRYAHWIFIYLFIFYEMERWNGIKGALLLSTSFCGNHLLIKKKKNIPAFSKLPNKTFN